ncbi:hypothetical protein D9M71_202600 [compost metagenome]
MADRLVQQHAGPAGAHHHRQAAGRRGDRFQVDQRLAQRLAGVAHGPVLLKEITVVGAPAAAVPAALATAVLLDDHANVETHQRADVRRQRAVGRGYQHLLPDAGQAHGDLLDARVEGAGGGVDLLQQLDLLRPAQHVERVVALVQALRRHRLEGLHAAVLPGAGDRARGLRGLAQGLAGDGVAVGEAGLLAGLRAHADTLVHVEAAFLDDAVLEHPGLGHLALEVQVRGIDARAAQLMQQRRQLLDIQPAGDQQVLADGRQQLAHIHSVRAGRGSAGGKNLLCAATGMRCRMAACSSASRRASSTASPLSCSARTDPQGSTIAECP